MPNSSKEVIRNKAGRIICGAKKSTGDGYCQSSPIVGSHRCRFHGGTSPGAPKGSKHGKVHGIYFTTLSEEEQEFWTDIRLGEVDDELRMARTQLHRALVAQNKDSQTSLLPIVEESVEGTMMADGKIKGQRVRKVRKRTDYPAIIDRFLSRIGTLERTKMELESITGGDQLDSQDINEEFI